MSGGGRRRPVGSGVPGGGGAERAARGRAVRRRARHGGVARRLARPTGGASAGTGRLGGDERRGGHGPAGPLSAGVGEPGAGTDRRRHGWCRDRLVGTTITDPVEFGGDPNSVGGNIRTTATAPSRYDGCAPSGEHHRLLPPPRRRDMVDRPALLPDTRRSRIMGTAQGRGASAPRRPPSSARSVSACRESRSAIWSGRSSVMRSWRPTTRRAPMNAVHAERGNRDGGGLGARPRRGTAAAPSVAGGRAGRRSPMNVISLPSRGSPGRRSPRASATSVVDLTPEPGASSPAPPEPDPEVPRSASPIRGITAVMGVSLSGIGAPERRPTNPDLGDAAPDPVAPSGRHEETSCSTVSPRSS